MIVFWWRIRFTISVSWILRDLWWSSKKLYLVFGWQISEYMYLTSEKPPYQTALDEITRWYYE